MGTGECKLVVTPHNIAPSGREQANKNDCAVGTNIPAPFFVLCTKDNKPCAPDIIGKWNAAYEANVVGGEAAITMDSFLVCSKGGIIYPTDSGLGMALVNPASDAYKMSEFYLMNAEYMAELDRLTDLAFEMCEGDVAKTNKLLLQYMRNQEYTKFGFRQFAGNIDQQAVNELKRQFNRNGFFREYTYKDIYGNEMDIRHLSQTLMTYQLLESSFGVKVFLNENQIDNIGGWAGDFITGMKEFFNPFAPAVSQGVDAFIKEFYSNNLKTCSTGDMLQDIDAYCMYKYMEETSNKDKLFNQIFAEYNSSEIDDSLDVFLGQYSNEEWEIQAKTSLKSNAAAAGLGLIAPWIFADEFSERIVEVWEGLYEQNRKK